MSNIDQEIREALMAGDSEELQELGTEQNLFEMTMGTFRGRNRWWTVYGVVLMFALMAAAVFSVLQLLGTPDSHEIVIYGALLVFSMMAIGFIKIWFWMAMNRNAVIREILRLELRIVEISKKLDK